MTESMIVEAVRAVQAHGVDQSAANAVGAAQSVADPASVA